MEWNDFIVACSAALTIISLLCGGIYKIYKRFHFLKRWREGEMTKLRGIADDPTIELINSPVFIPTMGQKEAPHDSERLEGTEKRVPLIDLIINDIITNKKSINGRHYLVLAGSGMGKSVFSAALFFRYVNLYKFKKSPFPIYIFSLNDSGTLNEIQTLSTQERAKSIIILDALDENAEAIKDIDSFMDTLNEVTSKFRYVIITCRTHYFSNELTEPSFTGHKLNALDKSFSTYEKYYVSPITRQETINYLEYKYHTLISEKCQKAINLVEKCNDLMARPMILTFIDDILKISDTNKLMSVDIYGTIINAWFERECKVQNDISISELFNFSKDLALYMYDKWQQKSDPHLTEEEFLYFCHSKKIRCPYSFKVRSLINRTSKGSIKFSHRDFWEFFLAIDAIENPGKSYNVKGFEKAKQFSEEISKQSLNNEKLKSLPYVTPYRSSFISELNLIKTLEEIEEAKKSIARFNHKYHDKAYSIIYTIWEIIIKSWIMIPKVFIINDSFISDDLMKHQIGKSLKDRDYDLLLSVVPKIKSLLIENKVLVSLIIDFQQKIVDINSALTVLSDIQLQIKKIYELQFKSESISDAKGYFIGALPLKETVIFPYLFDFFNSKTINQIVNDDNVLMVFGYGFNNTEDPDAIIINNIKKISNTDIFRIYCIIKYCNDIEDLVGFIVRLNIFLNEEQNNCFLVLKAHVNGTFIYYLLNNTDNDKDTIRNRVSLMIKAKSKL